MQKFENIESIVIPLDRTNVDTDVIIPKQYLKSVKRSGLGPYLFDDWRYLDAGDLMLDNAKRRLNADCIFNDPHYKKARILLTGANFGCGSSREHAVWAMMDYGLKAVIAGSFADIFYNNAIKNGLLPVVLDTETIATLFRNTTGNPDYTLTISLTDQTVADDQSTWHFRIADFDKHCLLQGLDQIALTLQHIDKIRAYETNRRRTAPWLFK
ncbi:MAG: 3-isopropylmalate dehydratase small subunit [Gammaproteobacteria bacterium]|nr:3-isopropylmalate dehydratase small subunit [Gammaproteobacteria bacterium]